METAIPKTAIEYIHSLGRFSGTAGLHRIRALCKALGDPQDKLKFVHLAGTNGKGSDVYKRQVLDTALLLLWRSPI